MCANKLRQSIIFMITTTCLTFAGTSLAAEVYKWVDESGNTHYSDKKPSTQNHESLKVYSGSSNNARKSFQEQSSDLDERNEMASMAQKEADKEQARKKEIADKCAMIRENLQVIAETSRIRVEDNGKLRYLTPEEIAEKKALHEAQLKEFCQ